MVKNRKYKVTLIIDIESENTIEAKNTIANLLKQIHLKAKEIKCIHGKRTNQQNKSIRLYLSQLSEALNNNGITMQKILKPGFEIMPTPHLLMEEVWRKVQIALTGKRSTRELSRGDKEIENIYDVINKNIAVRAGIVIPFPDEELLHIKQQEEQYINKK